MLRSILIIFTLLFFTGNSSAEWQVKVETDLMTDKESKMAFISNPSGHTFSLFRMSDGRVFGNFRLSEKSTDQLSPENAPMFRIDKNEANDLNDLKNTHKTHLKVLGRGVYYWEPKWINFIVWHGDAKHEITEEATIRKLMNGKKILFRYYMPTGGFKHTEFSLKGANNAISEAFNIQIVK